MYILISTEQSKSLEFRQRRNYRRTTVISNNFSKCRHFTGKDKEKSWTQSADTDRTQIQLNVFVSLRSADANLSSEFPEH